MDFEPIIINLLVGAGSSFLGACVGSIFSQQKERRESYRRLLEKNITDIGNHCYQAVAIANTLNERIKRGQNIKTWLVKLKNNKIALENDRLAVRYLLWGCDRGFSSLIRLPTWVCLCRKNTETRSKLIKTGNKLRTAMDRAVRNAFTNGKKPNFVYILIIKYYVKKLDKIYRSYMNKKLLSV